MKEDWPLPIEREPQIDNRLGLTWTYHENLQNVER